MKLDRVYVYPPACAVKSDERKRRAHRQIGESLAGRIGAELLDVEGDGEDPDIVLSTAAGIRRVEHTQYVAQDEFCSVEDDLSRALQVVADALEQQRVFNFSANFNWKEEPLRRLRRQPFSLTRKVVPATSRLADEVVRLFQSLPEGYESYDLLPRNDDPIWQPVPCGERLKLPVLHSHYPEIFGCCRNILVFRRSVGAAWLKSEPARMVGFDQVMLECLVRKKSKMALARNDGAADWLLIDFPFFSRSSQIPDFHLPSAAEAARRVHQEEGAPFVAVLFAVGDAFYFVDGREHVPNLPTLK